MSVIDLESMSSDDLRKRIASLISLEDWADECGICECPSLLYRYGPCIRKEQEPPDVLMKI